MSILNCFISRDVALVSVDTHVSGPNGTAHASKLLPLPHAMAVVAMRGELALATQVASILNVAFAPDFDALVQAMGQALAQGCAEREAFNKAHGGIYPFAGIEIALVGWSRALNRMHGVRWERWPDDKAFKATPIDPWSLSPNPGYAELPPPPDSAERMEAVARDQFALLRSLPCVTVGGRLLLAELTRDSLSIRTITDLELRQGEVQQ